MKIVQMVMEQQVGEYSGYYNYEFGLQENRHSMLVTFGLDSRSIDRDTGEPDERHEYSTRPHEYVIITEVE